MATLAFTTAPRPSPVPAPRLLVLRVVPRQDDDGVWYYDVCASRGSDVAPVNPHLTFDFNNRRVRDLNGQKLTQQELKHLWSFCCTMPTPCFDIDFPPYVRR